MQDSECIILQSVISTRECVLDALSSGITDKDAFRGAYALVELCTAVTGKAIHSLQERGGRLNAADAKPVFDAVKKYKQRFPGILKDS